MTNNTWQTFVGGSYGNRMKFLAEMEAYGFSRRIPANTARGFYFGDQIIFLRWMGGKAQAFAEGYVTSVIFDKDISAKVSEIIKENFEVKYNPSSMSVQRECGEYQIQGSYEVKGITLPDIIKIAQSVAPKDEPLFCMIAGELHQEIKPPIMVEPTPKFTRGFIKVGASTPVTRQKGKIVAIDQYRRK